jgi:hypothetical protein
MAGLNQLVDKIRALHPGAYDDMDDATLTKKVLAKYPQYSDLAAPAMPKPPNPIAQVAAPQKPPSIPDNSWSEASGGINDIADPSKGKPGTSTITKSHCLRGLRGEHDRR